MSARRRPASPVAPMPGRRLVAVLDASDGTGRRRERRPDRAARREAKRERSAASHPHRPARPTGTVARPAPPLPGSLGRETAEALTSTERFAARARAERRAGRWRVVRRLAVAAIPVALAAVVFFSPVCAVRDGQIQVRGIAGVVTADQVAEVMAPVVGVPLARLDLGHLAADVESIRGVKSASVARVWPTGVTVSIEARIPVAAVADGGRFVLLDAEGVQLAAVAAPPAGVPEVDVPLTDSDARTLRTVLEVLDSIPASLAATIASIGAATRDTVHFTVAGGQHVVWGDASQPALKAAALE
ncbi:MAG: FtsQ-type POTRA domain-containing protein, partial [Bifidobacteriaceae bacterium]|nr:FtsQ-type POTRA domain-containing protein [Bifidobacteriaceae bacterium]